MPSPRKPDDIDRRTLRRQRAEPRTKLIPCKVTAEMKRLLDEERKTTPMSEHLCNIVARHLGLQK